MRYNRFENIYVDESGGTWFNVDDQRVHQEIRQIHPDLLAIEKETSRADFQALSDPAAIYYAIFVFFIGVAGAFGRGSTGSVGIMISIALGIATIYYKNRNLELIGQRRELERSLRQKEWRFYHRLETLLVAPRNETNPD